MIEDIGGWYRDSEISGDDELLSKRAAAAESLAAAIDKFSDRDTLDLCAFALSIIEAGERPKAVLPSILVSLKEAQPSFDQQETNAIGEAQICALVAIEHIITARFANVKQIRKREPAILSAEAVNCAVRFREVSVGDHFASKLKGLAELADKLLIAVDERRRQRRLVLKPDLTALRSAADPNEIRTKAATAITRIWEDSHLDREELQVLWWFVGEYSISARESYRDMPPVKAALAAGHDLADLLDWPGTRAFGEFAARVAVRQDNKNKKPVELEKIDENDWLGLPATGHGKPPEILAPVHSQCATSRSELSEKTTLGMSSLSLRELAIQTFAEASLLKKYYD